MSGKIDKLFEVPEVRGRRKNALRQAFQRMKREAEAALRRGDYHTVREIYTQMIDLYAPRPMLEELAGKILERVGPLSGNVEAAMLVLGVPRQPRRSAWL